MNKPRPNLFIAGAPKSATTSLYYYLKQHHDVYFPSIKEPHYFTCKYMNLPRKGPGDDIADVNLTRTLDEYEKLYPADTKQKILGDASVDYLYVYMTAEDIKEYSPDAKIIVILRNPVERAFSAYNHLVRDGREELSFEDALAAEEERIRNNYKFIWFYKDVGMYFEQVKHYLEVFGKENMKIITYEYFSEHTDDAMEEICDFLQIEKIKFDTGTIYNKSGSPNLFNKFVNSCKRNPYIRKIMRAVVRNKDFRYRFLAKIKGTGTSKTLMDKKTEKKLYGYFREDIENLEKLIQKDLSDWKI